MKIGIDCRMYHQTGIGRYIRNLLEHLQKIDRENNYYIFLLKDDFNGLNFAKNFHKVSANIPWYGLTEQIKFPKLINKYNLDLMHFPHFNVPYLYKGMYVVTIHDLIPLDFKSSQASTLRPFLYKLKYRSLKHLISRGLKNSTKIITVSDFVKEEIIKREVSAKSKIMVTPEAVENQLIQLSSKVTQQRISQMLEKFSLGKDYIFYVGNAYPHKNIQGLIRAFLLLKKDDPNLKLVLAGKTDYFWQKLMDEFIDKDIIYTGFISDEEMVALYKGAQCYVMPSFSEGFGIPLLEAMACGCPVVSSNAASLPEVGGNACSYFDPHDEGDMVKKISQVLSDIKLGKKLTGLGEKRYKEFSWEKMAKQTLEVYKKVME